MWGDMIETHFLQRVPIVSESIRTTPERRLASLKQNRIRIKTRCLRGDGFVHLRHQVHLALFHLVHHIDPELVRELPIHALPTATLYQKHAQRRRNATTQEHAI